MPQLEEELQRVLKELNEVLEKLLVEQIQPDPYYNVHFLFPRTTNEPRRTN